MFTSSIAREPSTDAWTEVTQLHDQRDFGTAKQTQPQDIFTDVCPLELLSKLPVVASEPWQGE